jgi:tetratricopeptide (TPR) repeat protein
MALALQGQGRTDDAIARFNQALEIRPDFGMARNNLGTLLQELGDHDGALEAFRTAVERDPTVAEAQANLGQMLIDLGDIDQGLEHCQEAVRLKPDFAAGHNNLGNAYRALNRWSDAHIAYAESVRLAPDLAKVHVNRGLAFRGDGRFTMAAESFRRAVELAPDDISLWEALASAHTADEDHAEAIPCFERLIEAQPERAQWHNELGWALAQEGRNAEAISHYETALELRPRYLDPIVNRGSLHETMGEMAEAEACYRRARELEPDAPRTLSLLGTMLRAKLPVEERVQIKERLDDPTLNDDQRTSLLFAHAAVSDAHEDYAEAATALTQANALALELNRKRGKRYDPVEHEQFIDRLIQSFAPEVFERLGESGDDTRQPVFVIGMPRSGTTLVEQVLASHSQVHGAGELRLARQSFESIREVVGREGALAECVAALEPDHLKELARRHLEGLQEIVNRSELDTRPDRIVDKMPDNYLYVGLIALLFPRATILHVRRDPRDIAFSCWITSFRSIRWANDLDHIAGRFEGHRRMTEHWNRVLPGRVHEVVYEQLVENFEPEARRLIHLCGLEWEPACLEFHKTVRPVRTASVTQVRQPLYRKSVARWTHYEETLGSLFERLVNRATD